MKEQKLNILTPYIRGTKGLISYQGGPNFKKGKKPCEHCGADSHRTPLNRHFLDYKEEMLVVDVTSNGYMIVPKSANGKDIEPEFYWLCSKCNLGTRPVEMPKDVITE